MSEPLIDTANRDEGPDEAKPEGPREAASRVGRELHQTPTVQEALIKAIREIGAVGKNEVNEFANYNFRGIDAVVNAASPAFRRNGIVVMPYLESVRYDDVKTSNNKMQTACRVVVEYVFTGPGGDSLACKVAGEAWDGGDKATPQAMSVAFRIALLQALCLPTHDPEVDARPPYERVEVKAASQTQVDDMVAGFKAVSMGGDEGRDARLAFFKDTLRRDTNGGDLTEDEAQRVLDALAHRYTAEQAITNSLGAKPIDPKEAEADAKADAADPDAEAAAYADQTAHADTVGKP